MFGRSRNGIFWAKECSGVHWGEPTGPGRTWPLSLFFTIVHLVIFFFFLIWRFRFECLFIVMTMYFYLKRTGWMTFPARLVLLHSNTSAYLFMEMHIWRLFVGHELNKFSCVAFTLRGRCGWYWTQYFNNPLYSWGCAKYIGRLGFISELQLSSVQCWRILTAVECYCQTIIYCPTQKLSVSTSSSFSHFIYFFSQPTLS